MFGNLTLCNILYGKRSKSDYQKIWNSILIGYSFNISNHLYIWASKMRQVIILNKFYINKLKQRAKLMTKWLLNTIILVLKRKTLAIKPRPRKKLRKIIIIKTVVLLNIKLPIMLKS